MDIVKKQRVPFNQGNAASEYSDIISRAQSWSRGVDTATEDIDAEKREEDLKFGVPHGRAIPHERDTSVVPKGGRTDGVKPL